MKKYVVPVDIVVYADSPEMARREVNECLKTGKGHIHTYKFGIVFEEPRDLRKVDWSGRL